VLVIVIDASPPSLPKTGHDSVKIIFSPPHQQYKLIQYGIDASEAMSWPWRVHLNSPESGTAS
jgi:hypothetical protein